MNKEFKKINFDKKLYEYFLFELISQKKLLNTIKSLKDVFTKQKTLSSIDAISNNKDLILLKFDKKGKFFRELAKHYVNSNKEACEEFNKFLESFDLEVSTDELIKFFNSLKEKHQMNIKDLVLFIHIYVEELLGLKMFKETAEYFEKELNPNL